jgi:hypothetical protein
MNSTKVTLIGCFTGLIVILLSCEKEVPTVITTEITGITASFVTLGGIVTDEGFGPVTERGVCLSSMNDYPTINDFRTIDGTGAGAFISYIENLDSETTYFVRAYATNSTGTGYGEHLSFTTPLFFCDPPNPWIVKK